MTNTEDESTVEVSTSEEFEKALTKIALLENDAAKTKSDNAKVKDLRKMPESYRSATHDTRLTPGSRALMSILLTITLTCRK